jgi:ABC-type uncharacterized transport system substrate-binding protein
LTVAKVKGVTAATIPIVSMTGDPVGAGPVASLARPGGNITGLSMIEVASPAFPIWRGKFEGRRNN